MHRSGVLWAAAGAVCLAGSLRAQSEFVLKDPPTDFEVLDYQPFDGIGDDGPYSTFNTVGLGLYGDDREMAEFDLAGVKIPDGEVVVMAVYEVQITSTQVWSFVLGVEEGNTPDQLSVYGYEGNGAEDIGDFQAGDYLDSADTSNPQVGQVVPFEVTGFVRGLVESGRRWAGFAIRGDEVGLMAIMENGQYPRLTIKTAPGEACYPDFNGDGSLDLFDFLAFVNEFNAQSERADCDGSGVYDLFDFLCFVNAFNDGC